MTITIRCAAALAVLIAVSLGVPDRASAQRGLWVGSTHAKLERETDFITASATARGDFWFRVGRGGRVRGHAVVAYDPTFDPAGLNDAINAAKTLGVAALGGFPLLPAIVEGGLANIIGVKAQFDDPAPGRQARISGTMRRGRLSLEWARGDTPGLPVRVFLNRVSGDSEITRNAFPVPDPWAGEADVGGGRAVGTFRQGPGGGEVKETRVAYWSAQRVNRR